MNLARAALLSREGFESREYSRRVVARQAK